MKKIYLILQSVFFVAALCVGFTSCNSEDDGMASPTENDSPNGDKIFTIGGVSFTMKKVTGGTFTMGATSEQGSDAYSDEKPAHQVTLSNYYIGETEVTQALWHAVMGSNPSFRKGVNLPVEQVSWNDCQEFITKLNAITGQKFRLPTEAEWEYAARGGNKSRGYKYSGSNNIDDVAWYDENSGSNTHPVKTQTPNELGIYDMSGNVWEWCTDWYGDYSSNAQTNPTGPSTGSYRVKRGGGWYNKAGYCRVSFRDFDAPDYRRPSNLGLRLACGDDTAGGTPENGNDNIATILGQWRLNFDQNSYVLLTFNQDGTMRYYEYDKNKVEEDKTYTYAYSDGWLQISKESKSIQVIKLTSTELILKDWPDGGSNIFTKVK